MKKFQNTVILFLFILASFQSFGQEIPKLTITDFSDLPAAKVGEKSFGYAGMLGGHQKDVFIVAGGANFPEGLPWEGGKKYGVMKCIFLKMVNGDYQQNNYQFLWVMLHPYLPKKEF
ncbi:hypothetical protein [Polaribacter ponticola]|uniref:Uncharacterized protein n=1 Tax=Polaribacter ponticola TaxID=2978475 RepID=A0ABT5SD53_9FLAO|nr:hypothetical protein [Polaribacter sp. MSW5]MDD7915361.1 hypothetical protein [Polaribacter sp. MSW5]